MHKTVILAVSALALTACGQQAQTASDDAASEIAAPQVAAMSDADFVAAAANANHYEIALSQLAADRAEREDVKALAAMLLENHNSTAQQFVEAVAAADMAAPSPALDTGQSDRINNLRNNSGESFDDAFLDTQVEVHEDAVQIFERYATTAPTGPLRTFAEDNLPTLRAHLERVQSLENAT